MTPVLPGHSVPHARDADAVLFGQRTDRRLASVVSAAGFQNDAVGQSRGSDRLPLEHHGRLDGGWMASLPDHVLQVGGSGAMPEVGRVDTWWPVARMAGIKASGNRTPVKLESDVSGTRLPTRRSVVPDDAVAVLVARPRPFPTRSEFGAMLRNRPVLLDLGPESNFERDGDAGHVARATTELPAALPDLGWVWQETGATGHAGALGTNDLSGVLARNRAESPATVPHHMGLDGERPPTLFAGTLNRHRDLPLTRNRGATPRAVCSSDGAFLRPNFTTPGMEG